MVIPSGDGYADYRREFELTRLPRYVRMGAGVAFAINTAFAGLDWLVYPEQFWLFAGIRLLLNMIFLAVFFFLSARYSRLGEYAICVGLCGAMLSMVYATDGPESPYYAGLILVFVGMGVFMPLNPFEAIGIAGSSCLIYLASPWATHSPVTWDVFGTHAVMLTSGAFICVASCTFLENLRFKDFEQRKEIEGVNEHLKEIDRQKSRFTANIHHELRTPLTLTLAPLEGLLGGEFGNISELQRDYLKTMHVNALRLLKLINNLLDLAKIESQSLKLQRRPTQIGAIVDDMVSGARPMAERKGVELFAEPERGLQTVNADPDAVEKVLINLIGNSLKFTEQGGQISVHAEADGDGVHVRVRDTGIGLASDQLERVFDRFAQADGSATRKHEGTGIGLSLCKELVELHGGRIWAESDGEGHGTTMHFVLPQGEEDIAVDEEVVSDDSGKQFTARHSFDAVAAEVDVESEDSQDYHLADLERNVQRWESANEELPPEDDPYGDSYVPEVLVVEDNADMRRLLHHLLSKEFKVRTARNGREGLEAVQFRHPELVLTDVMMPEMTGTELCRELKTNPDTQGIPVVLVTSKAEREMKIEGLELGADDYVTKPFHARELVARVRSLVRIRRLQEEVAARNEILERTNLELERTMKELEENEMQMVQAERLAAVGELAAGIAHEVNNPVNFATNALRTLRTYLDDIGKVAGEMAGLRAGDPAALKLQVQKVQRLQEEVGFEDVASSLDELLQIVAEGLERTGRLVGDLRDFASPRRDPHAPVDLRRCVDSTLQLVRHAMQSAGVEVEVHAQADLPNVHGDVQALSQVFLNLLKNSAEAIENIPGGVWVELRAEEELVVVEVRDNGPGIPQEVQEHLFEPFYTTKEAGQGTGLGLSISRRIVTEHGGTIGVSSTPGEGTTFTIKLPAETPPGAA